MRYQNFNVSIYCPVRDVMSITDLEEFDRRFQLIEKNIKIGKVYLETYRGGVTVSREQMLMVKKYFEDKGIETSGGITPVDMDTKHEGGFHSFCYTSPTHLQLYKGVVALTAELFDEFILDDFYFTNCRCASCIEAKGNRSWSEFRLQLMQDISENLVIKTAREVNPKVKAIIKYPNWYEDYQETGYNLEEEPKVFDYIYTGTETRNPAYTAQHLPKYLSYFIMRYLENVAPDRNLGGWFDPYECSYNLTSYIEQGYLTLFGKSKEVMLFCLGSLLVDKSYTTFPPAIGQVFEDVDRYFARLGNPVGIPTYLPYHGYGENYLHNYLGMCGIPFEPYPDYPEEAMTVFLTENAAKDPEILRKMQRSLKKGADVIVTSGFAAKLGKAFDEFMHLPFSNRKALVKNYMYSQNGGLSFQGNAEAAREILIPQLPYFTNDVWALAAAHGQDNNFPILLKTFYDNGKVYVLTIPEDPGDLYHYPAAVWNTIRSVLCKASPVVLSAGTGITLFTYDNGTFLLRSFLPYSEQVTITVRKENAVLTDLETAHEYTGITNPGETIFTFHLAPAINMVLSV